MRKTRSLSVILKPSLKLLVPVSPAARTRSQLALPVVQHRWLAQVRPDREILSKLWFTPSSVPRQHRSEGASDHDPVDERTLKLGKTLRLLQDHLPTLLASPLPQEILSPNINLHLFPSTHPHLPIASGRVSYRAALWTAPMAWGRVPIVGNVKLIILSERMGKVPRRSSDSNEQLIVKWKTCGKTQGKGMGALYRGIGASEQVDKITEWLGGDARDDEEFCGLFIFDFDEEGRILTHTIEHADQRGLWDGTSRVVSVTDWLLGKMNGREERKEPQLAMHWVGHASAQQRRERSAEWLN